MGSINKLFITLQARYGNQWANQWDDERLLKFAKHEWYEALKLFGVSDIKRGFDTYRGDYPPNIMQFAKSCEKAGKPAPCYQLWGQHDDKLRIDFDNPNYKKHGNKWLANLREIIRTGGHSE